MDIPNLFALTTQTKPSSFLANAVPSKPAAGLSNAVSAKDDITTELQANGNEILEGISNMLAQSVYTQEQTLNEDQV